MEKELQEFLRPGEQVRWQGQPGTFGLLEAGCKKQILFKWFLTALLPGAGTAGGGGHPGVAADRAAEPAEGPLLDHGPAGHHDEQGENLLRNGTGGY